ncbi:MAG: hypothetical protein GOMPHAMPRED_005358 [Gomphillus americanus]|uniref:Uncharacterized protein n=1 Tax=Gomphillus americanus TaxID=1940652 RepID=A0A8H3FUF1_9LECA|nr:MAG: hypothetical protein GOMPHAMPRED_005358 [Gomphillus americanus]
MDTRLWDLETINQTSEPLSKTWVRCLIATALSHAVPAVFVHTIPDVLPSMLKFSVFSHAVVQGIVLIGNSSGYVTAHIAHPQDVDNSHVSATFSEFRNELFVLVTPTPLLAVIRPQSRTASDTTKWSNSEKSTFSDDPIHLQSTVKSRVVNSCSNTLVRSLFPEWFTPDSARE